MTYTTAAQEIVPKAIPTTMNIYIARMYAGHPYARLTMVFGEYETLRITVNLKNILGLPVINAPVKIYIDDKYTATITTNLLGVAHHTLNNGISPPGTHIIRCVWEGDFWNAPSQASVTLKTVKMEEAVFTAYVETVANVSPAEIEQKIVDKCLTDEIGVVPVKTEADIERNIYILTMFAPTEPTSSKIQAKLFWEIIAAIIIVIVFILSVSTAVWVVNVFGLGMYECGACHARFRTCEARKEHIITAHPDLWEKIKDSYICESIPSPTPDWLKWVFYAGIGAVAIIMIIEIIRAVRR